MRRRVFITLLGGAAAWPLAVRAQQATKTPRIGILSPGRSENPILKMINAFLQGMRELGYIEGQNITIERRYADWNPERLAALAAELVELKPDIIVAWRPRRSRPSK